MPPSTIRTAQARPAERIASALAKCAPESAAYGRCIVADYNGVSKDKCLSEFMQLKNCYTKAIKQKS